MSKLTKKTAKRKPARKAAPQFKAGLVVLPALGAEWKGQGGFFAGIIRDEKGGVDCALIVSPPAGDLAPLTWADACKKAAALKIAGHADYEAPTQRQLNLCFANVPELFQKTWYWSSTQSSAHLAWGQGFDGGRQYYLGKDSGCRVRAVRRVPLQ